MSDSNSENEESASNTTSLIRYGIFALIAGVVILSSSSVIVNENEKAIILRFGKPVRVLNDAGWYLHFPRPVERSKIVDTRLQHGTIRLSETLTLDKRNVIIPMYFSWRIQDPLKFLNTIESVPAATEKLDSLITSTRNSSIGKHPFTALVGEDGSQNQLGSIEASILNAAQADAQQHFGIELVGLGMTEIKLPQGNTEAVFRRMRSERKREASGYRAEGKALAEKIKTEADSEARLLIAQARKYAQEVRGQAEADAAALYAEAHGEDVEFYRFLRSLQSLRSVVDKNTTLILDTKSPPFDLLQLTHSPSLEQTPQETEPPSQADEQVDLKALNQTLRSLKDIITEKDSETPPAETAPQKEAKPASSVPFFPIENAFRAPSSASARND